MVSSKPLANASDGKYAYFHGMRVLHVQKTIPHNNTKIPAFFHVATNPIKKGGLAMCLTNLNNLVYLRPCSGQITQKWSYNSYGELKAAGYIDPKKTCLTPSETPEGEELRFGQLGSCIVNDATLKKIASDSYGMGEADSQYYITRAAKVSGHSNATDITLCHRTMNGVCADFTLLKLFDPPFGHPYLTDEKTPKVKDGLLWYPYSASVDKGQLPEDMLHLGTFFKRPTGLCRVPRLLEGEAVSYEVGYVLPGNVTKSKNKSWHCFLVNRATNPRKADAPINFDILIADGNTSPQLEWAKQFATGPVKLKGAKLFSARSFETEHAVTVCRVRLGGQYLLGIRVPHNCSFITGGIKAGVLRVKNGIPMKRSPLEIKRSNWPECQRTLLRQFFPTQYACRSKRMIDVWGRTVLGR